MKRWEQIHVPVFPQNPFRHFSYFSIESEAFFPPRLKRLLPARVLSWVRTVSPVIGHLGKPEWPQVTGFALPEMDDVPLCLVYCTEDVRPTGSWAFVLGLWAGSFICFESEPCDGGREKAKEVQRWEGIGVTSERPAGSARLRAALHSDVSERRGDPGTQPAPGSADPAPPALQNARRPDCRCSAPHPHPRRKRGFLQKVRREKSRAYFQLNLQKS